MTGQDSAPRPAEQRASRTRMLLGGAALLAVAAVAAGAVVATAGAQQTASPAASPSPSASAAPRTVPGDVPAAEPIGTLPSDCDELYSPDMLALITSYNLPLNDPSVDGVTGARDEQLAAIIHERPTLKCSWGAAGEYGLTTNVTSVDPGQPEQIVNRLRELGFSCAAEFSGTRCQVTQNADGTIGGETHFLRDDIWLATAWVNFGPDGYTPDIIRTIFAD